MHLYRKRENEKEKLDYLPGILLGLSPILAYICWILTQNPFITLIFFMFWIGFSGSSARCSRMRYKKRWCAGDSFCLGALKK